MLPSVLSLKTNKPEPGTVFSVCPSQPHGTIVTGRRVTVDVEQMGRLPIVRRVRGMPPALYDESRFGISDSTVLTGARNPPTLGAAR